MILALIISVLGSAFIGYTVGTVMARLGFGLPATIALSAALGLGFSTLVVFMVPT